MIPKQSALAVILAACSSACVAAASYRLPIQGAEGPRYFQPIGVCAAEAGLSSVQHPSSVNVKYNDAIWIQYMVRGDSYDMVVVGEDPALEAKKKGDELFACAKVKGPGEMPAQPAPMTPMTPVAVEQTPAEDPPAQEPAKKAPPAADDDGEMACYIDAQCPKNNCTKGFCRTNEVGAFCQLDAHCNSNNCSNGACQTNDPGAACFYDMHCNSNNCTNNVCQTNDRGAACNLDSHCNSRNCTNHKCQ